MKAYGSEVATSRRRKRAERVSRESDSVSRGAAYALMVSLFLFCTALALGVSQCEDPNVDRCGSPNPALGYGLPYYGGPWGTLHRDGRNSDFADCEVASSYRQDWSLEVEPHFLAVKPVVGPNNMAWMAAETSISDVESPNFLYGVDIPTGEVRVALGGEDGLNGTVLYGQPLIDTEGNLYIGQEKTRDDETPCRFEGQAESEGELCGEFWSFDPAGTPRWTLSIDGAPMSAQWTIDGKILFQSWRGTTYVVESAAGVAEDERILFSANHFPEYAPTLPNKPQGPCVLFGAQDTCIIANTPAVHPATGAIYNTVQGFVIGSTNTFVQRWLYDPDTHEVALDPLWDVSAPLLGGSCSSPVIHFDGQVLFVNDVEEGVYALDAETGRIVSTATIPYSPAGSIIAIPELDEGGLVQGAYLIFNAGEKVAQQDKYVTIVHYHTSEGMPFGTLTRSRTYDGEDGSGVAWLAMGGSAGGVVDVSDFVPEMRFATLAEKSCRGCVGDGGLFLLIIDPVTGSILSEAQVPDVSLASVCLAADRSLITSHIGETLLRRFVPVGEQEHDFGVEQSSK